MNDELTFEAFKDPLSHDLGLSIGTLPASSTSSVVGPARSRFQSTSASSSPRGLVLDLSKPNTTSEPACAYEPTSQAISELRRISGLTWEQLRKLFGVSRRSIHFWASGKPLSTANEKRLLTILNIVRKANRGDARSTKAALFEERDGEPAFDLLAAQKFCEASSLLGEGSDSPVRERSRLSPEAQHARQPPAPDTLVDAMQESVHRDPGRGRIAKTLRNKKRGG